MTSSVDMIKQIHQGLPPIDDCTTETVDNQLEEKKPHTVNHYIGTKSLEEVE